THRDGGAEAAADVLRRAVVVRRAELDGAHGALGLALRGDGVAGAGDRFLAAHVPGRRAAVGAAAGQRIALAGGGRAAGLAGAGDAADLRRRVAGLAGAGDLVGAAVGAARRGGHAGAAVVAVD